MQKICICQKKVVPLHRILKITLLTIKIITTMTRFVYMVESRTEKSKFGFKMFSSMEAAKKFVSMLPEFKHFITKHELYNINSL